MEFTDRQLARFDPNFAKELIQEDIAKYSDRFRSYMKHFFYRYKQDIFYYNGINYEIMNLNDVRKYLPIDIKTENKVANDNTRKYERVVLSARTYIETCDFQDTEYKPTIDFTTNERVINNDTMINGHVFNDKFLNMAKPFNIDTTSRPSKYKKGTNENIKKIYDHILNILCDGNEELNDYFLNFIACTLSGRKLRKCIYIQSAEGTGKGLILGDLLKNIMGRAMHKTSSVEDIIKYTQAFEGTLLLNLDEMPEHDNRKEISDCLKSLITEKTFICRGMFKAGYEQKNTFNIIKTSNNNALSMTQTNKRRYVCLDVNESKVGNIAYFTELARVCNDTHTYTKFYFDMIDRAETLDKWNEDIIPETKNSKRNIIASLPRFYLYIKEQYILNNLGLDIKPTDLFDEYLETNKGERMTAKQATIKIKKDLNIITKKVNGIHRFVYSAKQLYDIFNNKGWIDEENDYIDNDLTTDDETTEKVIKKITSKTDVIKSLKICDESDDDEEEEEDMMESDEE